MLTTALDLIGVIGLCVFAWFCWPPLVPAVIGVAALAASRQITKSGRPPIERRIDDEDGDE